MEMSVPRKLQAILGVCIISMLAILLVLTSYPKLPSEDVRVERFSKAKFLEGKAHTTSVSRAINKGNYSFVQPNKLNNNPPHRDLATLRHRGQSVTRIDPSKSNKYMHGLLASNFEESTCLSRYQSSLYHKPSPHKPSSYLISKLRNYEALHRRCGPNTEPYNRSIETLISNNKITTTGSCKYIIWVPSNGLGNRILSLASTFLYALLTNRVLLLDVIAADMAGLFCEPFPNSSWLLPEKFPVNDHITPKYNDSHRSSETKNRKNMSKDFQPKYIYFNPDRSDYFIDKTPFYCDHAFALNIEKIPWLIWLSDQYFAPYLFLNHPNNKDLYKLFPEKDSVFHLLARYLFHPSNEAWGLITRFFEAYLAKADERIGIQARSFYSNLAHLQTITDQIFACTIKEKLLPQVDHTRAVASLPLKNKTSKAILVVSLHSEFYNNISNTYWNHPTTTGEIIEVYQPTHEKFQRFGDNKHDMKAWTEIYLLSLSDVLVTSPLSTFGYVAQGLGGSKPWILLATNEGNVPNPPCQRDMSMEPCYHFPPTYDCKSKSKVDPGAVLPFLRHCADVNQGVKLVNHHEM